MAALSEGPAGGEAFLNKQPGPSSPVLSFLLGAAGFRLAGGKIQFRLILFRAFDHWIHHVRLVPHPHLFPHHSPYFAGHIVGNLAGKDGRAARGKFVQHAQIKIPVQRKRKRPGNGGRGHDQDIRFARVGLLHQPEALQNPEPMLLIDHHQSELGEIHPLLDQGMGSNDQLRLAAGDQATVGAFAILFQGSG